MSNEQFIIKTTHNTLYLASFLLGLTYDEDFQIYICGDGVRYLKKDYAEAIQHEILWLKTDVGKEVKEDDIRQT